MDDKIKAINQPLNDVLANMERIMEEKRLIGRSDTFDAIEKRYGMGIDLGRKDGLRFAEYRFYGVIPHEQELVDFSLMAKKRGHLLEYKEETRIDDGGYPHAVYHFSVSKNGRNLLLAKKQEWVLSFLLPVYNGFFPWPDCRNVLRYAHDTDEKSFPVLRSAASMLGLDNVIEAALSPKEDAGLDGVTDVPQAFRET